MTLRLTRWNGDWFTSSGWADRPMQNLVQDVDRVFADIRDIEILDFKPR